MTCILQALKNRWKFFLKEHSYFEASQLKVIVIKSSVELSLLLQCTISHVSQHIDAKFVVAFSSRCRSLDLKSLIFLSENIII